MKDNRYLQLVPRALALFFSWCLFATTLVNPCKSFAQEDFMRRGPLWRSNFETIEPRYESILREEIKDRRSMFFWRFSFNSESLQTDQNINTQNVGALAHGKFVYKIFDGLNFNAKIDLNAQSGRSQDIFGDLEPQSGIYPREINLEWRPFNEVITLRAGQIHQRWINEPLFLGNLGFPGLQQTFRYVNKERQFDLGVITQQLIPTSATLATRVADREPTPYLFTTTAFGQWRPTKDSIVLGRLTHYNYTRLPHVVAYNSFLFGNSVTDTDINNAQFIYDFNGYMSQLEWQQSFTPKFSMALQWNMIKNMKAPDELGEAQAINTMLYYDFGKWIAGGKYKNFFIEADAVPGFYNSHRLGHNNRIGHSLELNLESKDMGVIFRGSYTRADLLNATSARIDGLQQDNQQTIYFVMETMYDFI